MNTINPFCCPGCGNIHDLRDTPEGALSYEFTTTTPTEAGVGVPKPFEVQRCIFTLREREDSRIVLTYDPKCTHTAAGMDLVLGAAQVIKSAKRSGKTLEKIYTLKSDVITLTKKVDGLRSIMAILRKERDQAVAENAIQDQAYHEASTVRAIISNSQSKAMLRMAAALADILPPDPDPKISDKSRDESITMHAIVLTDVEWAAWLERAKS